MRFPGHLPRRVEGARGVAENVPEPRELHPYGQSGSFLGSEAVLMMGLGLAARVSGPLGGVTVWRPGEWLHPSVCGAPVPVPAPSGSSSYKGGCWDAGRRGPSLLLGEPARYLPKAGLQGTGARARRCVCALPEQCHASWPSNTQPCREARARSLRRLATGRTGLGTRHGAARERTRRPLAVPRTLRPGCGRPRDGCRLLVSSVLPTGVTEIVISPHSRDEVSVAADGHGPLGL